MKIHLFGTASAEGGIERDNTSLFINLAQEYTFIDISGNPLGKLKQIGITPHQIKRAIITHFHLDHYYGLPSLLWGMSVSQRKEPFDIHCPADYLNKLNALLEAIEVKKWSHPIEVNIKPFKWDSKNNIINTDDFSIDTFPAIHGTPNVGLDINYNTKRIVYSSDTEPNPIIKNFESIDLLIHEATTAQTKVEKHTSLKELLDYYPLNNIEKIILVHLSDNEPYIRTINDAKLQNKKIEIGYDGMKLCF